MKNKIPALLFTSILLTACDASALDNISAIDRSNTLQGVDANSNGIRDDLDKFIRSSYAKQEHINAASQMARAMQQSLTVDISDAIAVKKISIKAIDAINCIYLKFDRSAGDEYPARVIKKIESLTTNTKQRLLTYLAFNKALDGTSWTSPQGDTCE
jgi:hypothetical protein